MPSSIHAGAIMSVKNGCESACVSSLAKSLKSGVALASIVVAACLVTSGARASGSSDDSIKAASNATQSAIQSAIQTVRDQLRWFLRGTRALPLNADPYAAGYDPFEAMGYAKSGMVTKARPMAAPAAPSYFVSIWGQGSADYERRSLATFAGLDFSSRSTSYTGLGGGDVVRIGLVTSSDALVIGVLGSHTTTDGIAGGTTTTSAETPGVGTYLAYINGAFSVDLAFVASFTNSKATTAGITVVTKSDSYNLSGNVQNRFDLPNNYWVEPTVGFSYTVLNIQTGGFIDGHTTRLQGGARVGTEWTHGAVKITPSLTGLAYSEVDVETPRLAGTLPFGPTDKGYLWGKGIGKVNFQWTDKFSTSLEGEVRGRADVVGYAGRVQVRYTF